MKRFLWIFLVPLTMYGAEWAKSAVFYQIFPLSFYDADGDGRGDLNGITARLDYLTNLGVNAVWLTPIFLARDYHGYSTIDYFQICPRLGTMADFDRLIVEARRRGIRVILDLVINHTSTHHPWFVDSTTNRNSPFTNFYIWSERDLGWPNPTGSTAQPAWNRLNNTNSWRHGQYYYGAFNLVLPDLNLTNPQVVAEVKRIVRFWINRGVDGFRVDAARYFIERGEGQQKDTPETIAFMDMLTRYMKAINPEIYVIAEVFASMEVCAPYFRGPGGLDAVFNFDFGGTGDRAIFPFLLTGRPAALRTALEKYAAMARLGVPATFFSLFLSNHDTGRLSHRVRSVPKQKIAAVLQFTLPGGAPFIYYGDEIGQFHGSRRTRGGGHSELRYPLWWSDERATGGFSSSGRTWVVVMQPEYYHDKQINVAAYQRNKQSLWHVYRNLISLRRRYAVLQTGDFVDLPFEQAREKGLGSVLTYARTNANHVTVVLINGSATEANIQEPINLPQMRAGRWRYVDGLSSADLTRPVPKAFVDSVMNGQWNVKMPGNEFAVMVFERVR